MEQDGTGGASAAGRRAAVAPTGDDTAPVTMIARAKVNLALHITGQRGDGYHRLDSIVAFARLTGANGLAGDRLAISFAEVAAAPRLTVDGPFAAHVPDGPQNSAAAAAVACGGIGAIHLTKALPVAAGIGGGSADAAAVLSAVAARRGIPVATLMGLALSLGADVPVCLLGEPARMSGIGEEIAPLTLPPLPCVLLNPGVPVSTPAVFAALQEKNNPPLPDAPPPETPDALIAFLESQRNDLEAPAIGLVPEIGAALAAVRDTNGCRLARMSGSGGTVFGLYGSLEARDAAAAALAARAASEHSGWWIAPALIEGSTGAPR